VLKAIAIAAVFGATLLFAACRENVVSPGACPDFCPTSRFEVMDTVVTGSLERDEWAAGYLQPDEASAMQVVWDSTARDSWGLVRFVAFTDSLQHEGGVFPILSLDSFRLQLSVLRAVANVEDLKLVVHRVPADIDETTTYDDLVPYFEDSTVIATIEVADTLETVSGILPPDAFPSLVADDFVAAVGIALRTDSGGFVDLGTSEVTGSDAILTRYVTVEQAGDTSQLSDSRQPNFDSFVAADAPAPGAEALAVGGIPSARAILRVALPDAILDSSDIVRATLILVPEGPALGGPGDSVLFQVFGLREDLGLKSPFLIPVISDTVIPGSAKLPVGSMDTVRVDITHILRPWQADSTLPNSLLLTVVPEAASLAEIRLLSTSSAAAPSIHVTYVPLFLVEEL
jgi:hypothetical protein